MVRVYTHSPGSDTRLNLVRHRRESGQGTLSEDWHRGDVYKSSSISLLPSFPAFPPSSYIPQYYPTTTESSSQTKSQIHLPELKMQFTLAAFSLVALATGVFAAPQSGPTFVTRAQAGEPDATTVPFYPPGVPFHPPNGTFQPPTSPFPPPNDTFQPPTAPFPPPNAPFHPPNGTFQPPTAPFPPPGVPFHPPNGSFPPWMPHRPIGGCLPLPVPHAAAPRVGHSTAALAVGVAAAVALSL